MRPVRMARPRGIHRERGVPVPLRRLRGVAIRGRGEDHRVVARLLEGVLPCVEGGVIGGNAEAVRAIRDRAGQLLGGARQVRLEGERERGSPRRRMAMVATPLASSRPVKA